MTEKVPHSICAQAAVKMIRARLRRIPKKNWDAFLGRVDQNIHKKWARKSRQFEAVAVERKTKLLSAAYAVASAMEAFRKEFYLDLDSGGLE